MSRISITLATAIGITVCLTLPASGQSTDPDVCGTPSPPAVGVTNILYRDSSLEVKPPVTKIGKGTKWRFHLQPRSFSTEDDLSEEDIKEAFAPADYDDAIVTIKGKTGTPFDNWLHVSGTRVDSPLTVCVPDRLEEGDTVFFTVTVESVGTLDPRGDVVN